MSTCLKEDMSCSASHWLSGLSKRPSQRHRQEPGSDKSTSASPSRQCRSEQVSASVHPAFVGMHRADCADAGVAFDPEAQQATHKGKAVSQLAAYHISSRVQGGHAPGPEPCFLKILEG